MTKPRCTIFAVLLLTGVLCAGAAVPQQTAGQIHERALQAEEVQGDLQTAIALYRKVLDQFPKNREVAAKALFQMGVCQEKLGNIEARRLYEQLLRDYPDQAEPAASARARLAALKHAETSRNGMALTVGQVYAGSEASADGSVSPDGKYLSFPDRGTADLAVLELATGKTRRITNHRGSSLEHWGASAFSPDGGWIAYSSSDLEAGLSRLNLMPAAGGKPRELLALKSPEDFGCVAWAPDSLGLLFVRRNILENKSELWRISLKGGEAQSLGLTVNSVSQISVHPDGQRIAYNAGESKSEIWVMENWLPLVKANRRQPAGSR